MLYKKCCANCLMWNLIDEGIRLCIIYNSADGNYMKMSFF